MRASTSHHGPPGAPLPAPVAEAEPVAIPESDEPPPLVLAVHAPARRVILPMESIDADKLGIGELLDMADKLGTDLDGVAAMMRTRGINQARIVVAFAWILARRQEPEVTWQDAQLWRVEVQGEPAKSSKAGTPRPRDARRGSAP